jgi:predicted RNA-binding Zn-ribbon protein involved in translation (DUF1610 family)
MGKRNAIIVAASVEVQCPHCGEPQPSPDNGSHVWMTSQVAALSGQVKTCVSCDETFTVQAQSRVSVEAASS